MIWKIEMDCYRNVIPGVHKGSFYGFGRRWQELMECRTYVVLEKNGSIFIKLGQHLAAMGYLLPLEWTMTFIPLQDRCPVSSMESIRKV